MLSPLNVVVHVKSSTCCCVGLHFLYYYLSNYEFKTMQICWQAAFRALEEFGEESLSTRPQKGGFFPVLLHRQSSVRRLIGLSNTHIRALPSAGCLPLWKSFVEELFQRGLIKAVFATETLAAGINMPARTTVLSSLSKRGDNGISLLTSNAMLQMAGRAGRRGIDTKGHVVSGRRVHDWTRVNIGIFALEGFLS